MFEEVVISRTFDKVPDALVDKIKEGKAAKRTIDERKLEAIGEIKKAVIKTNAYMHDRTGSGEKDRKRELELALIWQEAGQKIRSVDYTLWEVAEIKALGWSDPQEWGKVTEHRKQAIKLDKILEQCRYLLNESS